MKLTKAEKAKIKKALFHSAMDGNVQAAKLLLELAASVTEDPLEKMDDDELRKERDRLLNELAD